MQNFKQFYGAPSVRVHAHEWWPLPTFALWLLIATINNTIVNITNRVWTNFGSKMLQTSSLSCYIFCSPCSYPFHQTARILAAQLCCTFVPCLRHLSFGVVQLFLQFFPLSIIFLALFCFISSRLALSSAEPPFKSIYK